MLGEEVVVTADREKIQLDVAQSQAIVEGEETIETIPTYGIEAVFESQPGVSRSSIRGGGVDETLFMLDDQAIVDDRLNRPFIDINMSAVKEVQIQTGGFQAEYGNVRSGVINVITKEGGDRYTGSVNFRYSPAAYKHFGPCAYGENTWEWNIWGKDESLHPLTFGGYEWEGWNEYVKDYKENNDDNPANDITAEDALEVWRYHHREKDYKKPDHDLDMSFGGPIPGAKLPVIGGFLDKTSFLYSYRYQNNKFIFPSYRDGYYDNNSQLKITHQLTPNLKITASGLYGETESMGSLSPWLGGTANGGLMGKYYDSRSTLYNGTRNSQMIKINHVLSPRTFYEVILSRFYSADSSRHTPNRNPFILEDYDINVEGYVPYFDELPTEYLSVINAMAASGKISDTELQALYQDIAGLPEDIMSQARKNELNAMLKDYLPVKIGNYWYDESPHKWKAVEGERDQVNYFTTGAAKGGHQYSDSYGETISLRASFTSQINKNNLLKTGLEFNYSDIWQFSGTTWFHETRIDKVEEEEFHGFPKRGAFYVQDKLEFRGMIANLGVRADYYYSDQDSLPSDPWDPWYGHDPEKYPEVVRPETGKVAPKFKVSPRIGISHPIGENTKIYFNYGHFYSMPPTQKTYGVYRTSHPSSKMNSVGNPDLDMPRTIAYELGMDQNIFNFIRIHIAGYYKDNTSMVIGTKLVRSAQEAFKYTVYLNNMYQDIKGFEVRINKDYGGWLSGWFYFNYMMKSEGVFGVDLRDPSSPYGDHWSDSFKPGDTSGLYYYSPIPYEYDPLPEFKANVTFSTPASWGPGIGKYKPFSNWNLSIIQSYHAGDYFTWNPGNLPDVRDNVQWMDYYNTDLKLAKYFRLQGIEFQIYMDVTNVLNQKRLNSGAFDSSEWREYMESLKLSYENGEEQGNDRVGKYDADYVKMPVRNDYLLFLYPRDIFFGIRVNF